MSFPDAGEEAADLGVAVVEEAFVAEEVFPENVFIARHGDEVGVGKIFAAGVEAETDVVLVINALLFFVDVEEEGLEGLGGLRRFVFVPGSEIAMFVCRLGEVFGDALESFGVERWVIRFVRGGQDVSGCVLGEYFGEFVGLASDEFFDFGLLRF